MKLYIIYFIVVFSLIFSPLFVEAKDYYIAANALDGGNGGQDSPWNELSDINNLAAGDRVLLKRGDTWIGMLPILYSGTENKPIIFDAYGNGEKPIITGKDTTPKWNVQPTAWAQDGTLNRWSISSADWSYSDPRRMWFKKPNATLVEGQEVTAKDLVTFEYSWYYDQDANRVYVYSKGEPTEYFDDMKSMHRQYRTVSIIGQSHVQLNNLQIEGSNAEALSIRYSSHIDINNCTIGVYSGKTGIIVTGETKNPWRLSEYVTVRNCEVNSGYMLDNFAPEAGPFDGIKFADGVRYSKVYQNFVKNWGHVAITFLSYDNSLGLAHGVENCEVFDNEITAPELEYGQAISNNGANDLCKNNLWYRNNIHHYPHGGTFQGKNSKFYQNKLTNIFGSSRDGKEAIGKGLSLANWTYNGQQLQNEGNEIYDNTFENIVEPGIVIELGTGEIKSIIITNNKFFSCGSDSGSDPPRPYGLYIKDSDHIKNIVVEKNYFYHPDRGNSGAEIYYRGSPMNVSSFNESDYIGDKINGNIQDTSFIRPPANISLTVK